MGASTYLRTESQIVVSTALPPFPGTSNSFWLTLHQERWHLVTWAPRVYLLPGSADVVAACLACLQSSGKAISTVPDELVESLGLELLEDKEVADWLG